jgi:hypothetical protein
MSGDCANAACGFWDLACRMDAHEGQAAWAQAVLSFAAIVVTAWIALGAWLGELDRRRSAARVASYLALAIASSLDHMLADHAGDEPFHEVDYATAGAMLNSGIMQDALSGIADVRPNDLPGPQSAAAFLQLRQLTRGIAGQLGGVKKGAKPSLSVGRMRSDLRSMAAVFERSVGELRPSRSDGLANWLGAGDLRRWFHG